MIPQDEHPDINFVGLLIGPRGNTLKCLFNKKKNVFIYFIIYIYMYNILCIVL